MTWVVDGRTFARKVKNPDITFTRNGGNYCSKDIECPACGYLVDQSNAAQDWPGLPVGVKFDPSDKELLEHLATKTGGGKSQLHPFIDEFIPTLDGDDGICYTHPENLPGIRHDGSSTHYFHTPARAYTTGTRKRRKIQSGFDEGEAKGELRWHKTGKTRPIVENGKQLGCKKIMVLYLSMGKKTKPEKTNWVMHQYHLGVQEEEREGELVVSKVFYQTQQRQSVGGHREDECLEQVEKEIDDGAAQSLPQLSADAITTSINSSRGAPTTPQTPAPPWPQAGKQHRGLFETISEDVYRITASLNGNAFCTNWYSDQSTLMTGFNSLPNCRDDERSQVAVYSLLQGSMECGDQDTGNSLDRTARSSKEIQSNQQLSYKVDTTFRKASNNGSRQDFHSSIIGFSLTLDDMPEEQESNADPALENIVLDTPPELLLDSLMNSQDTLDWLGKKKFGDSQKGSSAEDLNAVYSLLDSQSST